MQYLSQMLSITLRHVKVAHKTLQKNVETTGTARSVWINKELHFSCFTFIVTEIFSPLPGI